MLFEDLINVYGSASQASRYLGLTKQAISNWQRRGFIPYCSQMLIQEETKGILRADKEHTRRYKPVKAPHQPAFRYYSEVYGMCPVTEIKFRQNNKPKIKFAAGNRIIYTFCTEHLMQASSELDTEGVPVFENDVVEYAHMNEKHRYKFLSIENVRYLRNLKPFKIVGTIYNVNY
jgi:DNA-binding transcriptional regulator Cro